MLSIFIRRLEEHWPKFKQESLTPEEVIALAEEEGLTCRPDPDQVMAQAVRFGGRRRFIVYNPALCQTELTVALGHELAHCLLGHPRNITRHERWANAIGHLCAVPTPVIEEVCRQAEAVDPTILHWHLTPAMRSETAWQFCRDRLEIFVEYLIKKGGGLWLLYLRRPKSGSRTASGILPRSSRAPRLGT